MTTGTTASRNFESGNVCTRTAGGTIPYGALLKLDTTEGQVIVTTAITDLVVGVSMGVYSSGERCEMQTGGVAPVLVGEAIALGAEVMPIGTGGGKGASASGATARSVGVAESATDTDGQYARVRLCIPNVKGPANA